MKKRIILGGLLLCSTTLLLSGCFDHNKDKQETTSSSTPKSEVISPKKGKPTKIKSQLTSEESQQLNDYLKQIQFSGTIMLVKNNQPIYAKAMGFADKELNKKNTIDSTYQIASVQKIITATAVLKLIEEGKLSFDDTLSQFYPNFPHGDQITIQSMLNMTSGLHLPNEKRPNKVFKSQDDYVKYYAKHATFAPTHKWKYEAVNYSLLAAILEKVTHKSYDTVINDLIIKPLKLTNIGFVSADNQPNNISIGHSEKGADDPYTEKDYQYAREVGTGNMYSSAPTLYKLLSSIIQGKIISPTLFASTHTIQMGNRQYLAGCYVQPNTYMMHGMGLGYDATVVISKNGKDAVIILCNKAYKQYIPKIANLIYENLVNWIPQDNQNDVPQ